MELPRKLLTEPWKLPNAALCIQKSIYISKLIQFYLKLEFSNSSSESKPAYRAIAPLRLLLLREARPDFHSRFEWLMDYNEERRKDQGPIV